MLFDSASERSLGGGEEEDFPRGGQSALSELEKRVIREQATEEALFNEVIYVFLSSVLHCPSLYVSTEQRGRRTERGSGQVSQEEVGSCQH